MAKGKDCEISFATSNQETFRPWSQLPHELLQIISSKVIDIVDYIQFRSVCTSWRSNAKPSNLRPQLPHLLLPNNPDSDALAFFELSDYKISTSEFPESRNKIICGSSLGWVVLIDATDLAVSLWNPFTRAKIQLPPPSGFPYYLGPGVSRYLHEYRMNDENERGYHFICKGYPWKVSLSTHPSNDCCIVVVTLACAAEFAFCRLGDEYWTVVDTTLPWPLHSVLFHEGNFYAFDEYAVSWAYKLPEYKKSSIPSPDDGFRVENFHIVKTDKQLLMVICYKNFQENEQEEQRRIRVFKLDSDEEEMKWVEVDSIGDSANFLSGHNSSVARALDFPECREDCIYLSAPHETLEESDVYYIDVYDMKEKQFQPLYCPWISGTKRKALWIAPSLH